MDSFAHLHCHSHYSTLDGASTLDSLLAAARRHNQTALALTDHGNLHGAVEFYKKAKAAGIKPLLGIELYTSPGSRCHKVPAARKSYHLTLLAQNTTGFHNLIKLSTEAYRTGFYYKPRADFSLLAAHAEGVICLSGCVAGELSTTLLPTALETWDVEAVAWAAEGVAAKYEKIYGKNYYLEIQNNGLQIQQQAAELTSDLARRMGIPLVATSDCHYAQQSDAAAQDLLLCIGTKAKVADAERFRFAGDAFHLRSAEEMLAALPGHEDAVRRSQDIADSIDIDLHLGERHFPKYKNTSPLRESSYEVLRRKCFSGLRRRLGVDPTLDEMGRLGHELSVIKKLGFVDYFLIIDDIFAFAFAKSIPASIRGSGVGSLVCYALSFTDINPLTYNLLFERFLDESRREWPDIDIDVCQDRRHEILAFIRAKYGEDHVAQIGTFGTLGLRAALRDVARVTDAPATLLAQIMRLLPERPQHLAHLGLTVDDALAESPALANFCDATPAAADLLRKVKPLVGLVRHIGTHAAAVVIGDKPLDEIVPLCRVNNGAEMVTQYAMKEVEDVGLLKLDLLGLRNLTLIKKACDLAGVDIANIPLDDAATLDIFRRGQTTGVFQFESPGMQKWLRKLRPDTFDDIVAMNALYRPGPLLGGVVQQYVDNKHGRKNVVYVHPILEPILRNTRGVMVFQEQVMQILHQLGGIDLAYAYTCIKAISKKKASVIDAAKEQFMQGCGDKGVTPAQASDIWNKIIEHAHYGFNKSHSCAYSLIAYRTAYLKAHHPREFMAALLTMDIAHRNLEDLSKDRMTEHLRECLRMRIPIIAPDVNTSSLEFTVSTAGLHFPLTAIRGLGKHLQCIVDARARGPFTSFYNFLSRVGPVALTPSIVKILIEAGCLDSTPGSRESKLLAAPQFLKAVRKRNAAAAQLYLFDTTPDDATALPEAPPTAVAQRLAREKALLGFYVTPLTPAESH